MTIIVTGAAGFIGSNLIKALNQRGETDIIAVDDLTDGDKFLNLVDCEISDYIDKRDFLERFARGALRVVRALLHQGACSSTMEGDGRFMMDNNYRYSCELLDACQSLGVPFLYASSAAVYGGGQVFRESRDAEQPLNVYGYSKFLFDQKVRRLLPHARSQIVGLRYFNVYGPREQHKGRMASVAFHCFHQYRASGKVSLFGAYDGIAGGEHQRDFVSVEDVSKVNLHFLDSPQHSGIFNLGSGLAQSFNDVAVSMVNSLRAQDDLQPLSREALVEQGLLEYTEFPDALRGKYQSFTQADIELLREAGYQQPFLRVEQGVERYCRWLLSKRV